MHERHHVFLSYSHRDAAHAEKVRRLLGARADVSLASSDDLAAGESWLRGLRGALAGTNRPLSLPVQLEDRQVTYLRDFRKPEDFDPWLVPANAAALA